ncbi:MAG: tyrosine-type recombinase/integrase [Clostridia bacterium]
MLSNILPVPLFVFCNEFGKPLDPKNFTRTFKRLLDKAGLDSIRFHDMRHTFVLLAMEQVINEIIEG